ncbi:FAD-dependent oxidoreductase [Cupriavidus basilensis]
MRAWRARSRRLARAAGGGPAAQYRRPRPERAGVAVDARGYIQVDEQLRTNVPGIWALGDRATAAAPSPIPPTTISEIVAANLLDAAPGEAARTVGDRIPAYALYTDPPLGRVGGHERARGEAVRTQRAGGHAADDPGGPAPWKRARRRAS